MKSEETYVTFRLYRKGIVKFPLKMAKNRNENEI